MLPELAIRRTLIYRMRSNDTSVLWQFGRNLRTYPDTWISDENLLLLLVMWEVGFHNAWDAQSRALVMVGLHLSFGKMMWFPSFINNDNKYLIETKCTRIHNTKVPLLNQVVVPVLATHQANAELHHEEVLETESMRMSRFLRYHGFYPTWEYQRW